MARHALLALSALFLFGCGSDAPFSPGGGSRYSQTVAGSVAVFGETRHPLTVPVSGDLTLRLTWANANVDLDLYLASSSCTESMYPLSTCGVILASLSSSGTSETITRRVS